MQELAAGKGNNGTCVACEAFTTLVARRLCWPCYQEHRRNGTLSQWPCWEPVGPERVRKGERAQLSLAMPAPLAQLIRDVADGQGVEISYILIVAVIEYMARSMEPRNASISSAVQRFRRRELTLSQTLDSVRDGSQGDTDAVGTG